MQDSTEMRMVNIYTQSFRHKAYYEYFGKYADPGFFPALHPNRFNTDTWLYERNYIRKMGKCMVLV